MSLTGDDAGELLTLQRAAYVTEAQLYDDAHLPALTQTLPELRAEVAACVCLGVRAAGRLVAAVRARESAGVLHVGRLVVAPDQQGSGLGTVLLQAAEATTTLPRAALFTGARSTANLRLYERCGYRERHREQLRPGVELVHLTKDLPARTRGPAGQDPVGR
ncbi:GNAT family N-acetyltransferase [Modestobacter sp. I12A-02628]|uniref:GNAT family N-acetyltransferase n=1 Tax=Goekera deserti TaxID=2497753 RepID=A0A7K3WIP1_9ACTN|nr:GNAT family N-acetyltransferase [Goekera deserti]NDI46605.1 GNAT family N-acetyltransferase [Goekera deserti]NEL56361.1 GNAT family N-acetyltransferase [Goekera deserti]